MYFCKFQLPVLFSDFSFFAEMVVNFLLLPNLGSHNGSIFACESHTFWREPREIKKSYYPQDSVMMS